MFKKLFPFLVLMLGSFVAKAQLPCNAVLFSYTQVGNNVSFVSTVPVGYQVVSYAWNFGDGGTANIANPTHTYANGGSYWVCMTVTGYYGNNQLVTCNYCDSVNIVANAPCNANFTFTTSGNTATFTNNATGPGVITNYAWNFGDGNQSNLPNPVHTYANSGTYNCCLTIYGIANGMTYTCSWCDSVTVPINNQPCSATFTYSTAGALATFTNTATGPGVITNYNWTFGDGGTSNLPNPVHTYANTGSYTVCLTIVGVDSGVTYTCTWCDSVYVQIVPPAPCNGVYYIATVVGNNASFAAVVPVGYVINTYYWTFGDGGSSNLANPSHTYANNGIYNACMTISGTTPNNGVFQCTFCDSIPIGNVVQPCSATFNYTTSGATATFTNTATGPGPITNYSWTFGDGGTSNLPNPVHTYANTGSYTVCLTITGMYNGMTYSCTWCDSLYVQVPGGNPCNGVYFNVSQVGNNASFSAVVPAGYVINSYFWTFGDGGNSNLANPSHTYANSGTYNVCMTISGTAPNNVFFQCNVCDSITVGNNNQPCSATFTYTTSGATASFTNTATGPGVITSYNWTFGDGGTSNLPNPTHTYATTGWYQACLTIIGIDSGATYTCTWCDSVYVVVPGGNPCNGFSFNTTQAGNVANFTPVIPAGFTVDGYMWTFGDGGNSTLATPTHTYANNGWYNVCLSITGYVNNVFEQCYICDSIYVSASGVQDFNQSNSFSVYPNPSSNYIEIPLFDKNPVALKLYDVAGKIIKEINISNSDQKYIMNTESLSKGMYFIQMLSDKKRYHSNFIKQ
ncbi:MAG: PKD domain-containing protein [Bacteroidetes bacterium]|nr:PKD domain-containing protein [Bacteroidota bacterium]